MTSRRDRHGLWPRNRANRSPREGTNRARVTSRSLPVVTIRGSAPSRSLRKASFWKSARPEAFGRGGSANPGVSEATGREAGVVRPASTASSRRAAAKPCTGRAQTAAAPAKSRHGRVGRKAPATNPATAASKRDSQTTGRDSTLHGSAVTARPRNQALEPPTLLRRQLRTLPGLAQRPALGERAQPARQLSGHRRGEPSRGGADRRTVNSATATPYTSGEGE
jgi:hypothetical protein